MIRNWFLPVLSISLCGMAAMHVTNHTRSEPRLDAPASPPRSPYAHTLAAVGIVEPESEDIDIGTHVSGVVDEVLVQVGQVVDKGTPLFRIDDRQLRADLAVRESQLELERAELRRLEHSPRAEELPASAAKVRQAQAKLALEKDHYQRAQKIFERDKRVLTEEELVTARQNCAIAEEVLAIAQAEDTLLKAGTWEPVIAVARARVAQQAAQVRQTQVELERLIMKAPVCGQILRVNIRPGEFVGQTTGSPNLILGTVTRLHIRAHLDETDIHRFDPTSKATALVRGNAKVQLPLEFVRIEPYVQPKRSLTGNPSERVDTRVLQVVYALPKVRSGIQVGQQVDVFIEGTATVDEQNESMSPQQTFAKK